MTVFLAVSDFDRASDTVKSASNPLAVSLPGAADSPDFPHAQRRLERYCCPKSKPKEQPYKLADGRGMYLLVTEAGKYWRLDYRMDAKRKTLALGCYPDVPLER